MKTFCMLIFKQVFCWYWNHCYIIGWKWAKNDYVSSDNKHIKKNLLIIAAIWYFFVEIFDQGFPLGGCICANYRYLQPDPIVTGVLLSQKTYFYSNWQMTALLNASKSSKDLDESLFTCCNNSCVIFIRLF